MDFSLGLIAFHNISKSPDFFMAYATIILGGVFGFMKLRKCSSINFFGSELNSDWTSFSVLWVAISACAVKLVTNPIERLSIGLLCLTALIYLIKERKSLFQTFSKNYLFHLAIIGAINLKLFTNTCGIASFLVVNTAIVLVSRYMGMRAGLLASACFVLRDVANSEEIINDTFHKAEYFASFAPFGESVTIFPNIGYIEEWLPNVLLLTLKFVSFDQLNISLIESRYILSFLLSIAIFTLLFKKQSLFAALCLLFIPADRISLLVATIYSLLLIDFFQKQNKWGYISLAALLPVLFLTLSPSYGLILIFTIAWTCDFQKNLNTTFTILVFWTLQIYYLSNYFFQYFKIYQSLSASNLIAHGQSFFRFESSMFVDLNYSDVKIYAARLIFVFLVGAFIGQIYRLKFFSAIKTYKFILVLFACILMAHLYIQYAFTRIDPFGFTRIVPVGLAIVIIICFATDFFQKPMYLLLFFCAYITSINLINIDAKFNYASHHLRLSSTYLTFSEDNLALSESITNFANDSPIILYGNQPALINLIPNAILPPFTTPWVTVGNYPQVMNIDFFNRHQYPIYLGTNFLTIGDIDVRARAPILFKYLAEHYRLIRSDGLLYAIPNQSHKAINSELFSGFDIGKTSFYLSTHSHQDKMNNVVVECSDEKLSQKFRVISKNNFFFADMHCGSNMIPKVYFDGGFTHLEKI